MFKFQTIQSMFLLILFLRKLLTSRKKDGGQSPSEQLHGPLPLRSFATCRNGSREAKGIATHIPEVLTNSNSFGAKTFFSPKKKSVGKTNSTSRLDWVPGFKQKTTGIEREKSSSLKIGSFT